MIWYHDASDAGVIPPEIGSISSLGTLELDDNSLSGESAL